MKKSCSLCHRSGVALNNGLCISCGLGIKEDQTKEKKIKELYDRCYKQAQEAMHDHRKDMSGEYGYDYARGIVRGLVLAIRILDHGDTTFK